MRVAIARGGVIENIVEAENVPVIREMFPDAEAFEAVGVGIGWAQQDNAWVAPAPPVPPAPTFPTLTRKQLRNGLLSIGVTSAEVEAQIAAIPDPLEREAAMIDWQDTQSYQRDYPMINQIGAALGLPEEQIDALWLWSAGQ